MSRIFSFPDEEKPAIDKAAVLDFFEKRAEKVETLGPTRAVIYQDKSPDIAERRDAAEKALLYPKIKLGKEECVLDAGCGTGRWAELIIPACRFYHGVDVSPGLVRIAKQRFGHLPNVQFSVCSLDELLPEVVGVTELFSRILAFGVYIYLNDDAVLRALNCMAMVAARKAMIVVREPIALQNRLTLQENFSEDMDQNYSAIYRTEPELLAMFDATIGYVGFRLIDSGDVYQESELNNRSETKQRWFLFAR
jgi:SAM-dependent methyltransferase